MNRCDALLIAFVCCLACPQAFASEQGGRGQTDEATKAVISRATSHIVIDGVLDEPDWKSTPTVGEIRQREPHQDEKASEPTEVRLLYDSQNLYVDTAREGLDPLLDWTLISFITNAFGA